MLLKGLVFFFLFFGIYNGVNAQVPFNEMGTECYTLGTSTITFSADFTADCKNPNGITGGFMLNVDYSAGTELADGVSSFDGATQNILCAVPAGGSFCAGNPPSNGHTWQYRFSNTYQGSPYLTITLEYNNGTISPYFYDDVPSYSVNYSQNFDTRFLDIANISFASSSNTMSFDVEYFIELSEIITSDPARNITMLLVDYENGTSSQDYAQTGEFITASQGTSTVNLVVQSDNFENDGLYTFRVSFGNMGTAFSGIYPFSETYIYFDVEIASGTITTITIDQIYRPNYTIETVRECSLTAIDGCLINVFRLLVIPSDESVRNVVNIKETLENKFPFAYVFDMGGIVDTLYSQTNTASSSISVAFGDYGDINLISVDQINSIPFTSWLRTIIGYLLWFMFLVLIYDRTRNIFNRETV